mgnify:CR=1 FL=1
MFSDIDRFVKWLRRRNPSADTAKSYQYHLRKFTEVVGDCDPADVTLHDVDDFIQFQAERGLKSSSIIRCQPERWLKSSCINRSLPAVSPL